ncbi:tetratricopeptide repeat protein [Aquimarina brevivitae]|uniref:Tetratricopeptide repeat protein n=1 Tax=Aquimarina brevivitae TaxID=323412 RepID=A0A4Q7NX92_9FLAO|nr:tetratricopeptide repeat protein [Aquimarina brevivitae]RZS91885.1 tetratricopeptide repeat protein [Aquimarina brevivitae]
MNRFIFLILFVIGILSIPSTLFAQQSAIYTNDLVTYNKALELYNNKQFLAAQRLFDFVRDEVSDENIKADCSYYIANCAVWLNQKNADQLMEDFVTQYPTSIKKNAAYLDVANYYFDNGNYAFARKWYDRVDQSRLSRAEQEKYNFNNGYAYFKIQRFNEARKYLNRVQNSAQYGSQSKYYLGFIAYEGDDYQEATKLFDEVRDLKEYDKNLSYFQSDMSFKSGNFQEAIDEGLKQLPTAKPTEKSELNKIIGESYFNLQEYDKAIPYLQAYQGRKGKWNNTDYYQLGYAYYKQSDYQSAIAEFNKIISGNNAVAQNAYYHLAESYLETGKKQEALNAFKNASEMDFDPKIKKDAFYNYAKLSYDIGNSYESTPTVLLAFLDQYPDSVYVEEINELLISSYITSKNYKEAMTLLETSRNFENKIIFQKVAFYRGIELFNKGEYTAAKKHFDLSLSQPRDQGYVAKATYWKAESDYLLQNFKEALIGYKEFEGLLEAETTEVFDNLYYNIGYTYFKIKQYEQAAEAFSKFAKQSSIPKEKLADTYLRIGDSYFVSSKYWPAMEAYNSAIKLDGKDADYAHYQKAISYGFVDRNEQKIKDLELFLKLYERSVYKDEALYQLGNTYVAVNKIADAIAAYNKIITTMPNSIYVPKALLKQGLIYYNGNDGARALSKFKKVVADYPGTPESIQAVSTARLIYVDLGKTNEYASWVKGLSFIDISNEDLDNTAYEAAEKQYLDGSDNAVQALEAYLEQFPNGIHQLKSHFYLAQLLVMNGQKMQSIPHYKAVIAYENTEYTEESLAKLAQIYLQDKKYEEAIPILERLEQMADQPENIVFAQSNLMKSYYSLVNYTKTLAYAQKVLANPKVQEDVKADAKLFLARAAMQTADEATAEKAYAEVRKIASGEIAAEALYYEAYFKHVKKEYKSSNASIQELAKNYSGYKLYGAKGLVLMAKNFYQLGDAYQATYILESVIKNFTAYPDVMAEAKKELQQIKSEEAKTNSSIQTEQ